MTRAQPKIAVVPVHDAAARAGDDRRRRPPAGAGRHPGPDRGRLRRRRASATTSSRTSSARGCSCTCWISRRWTARDPGAQLRGDRARARRARSAAGEPAAAAGAVQGRSRDAGGGRAAAARSGARGSRSRCSSPRARRVSGWTSCAASCWRGCRWPSPSPRASGEDEVAEFAVFRPAKSQDFEITRGPDGGWIVTGDSVDRLIMRWDLENEEAAGARRGAAAAHGRDRGAGAGRLRTRRRRRDRRHRLRARSLVGFAVPVAVVKLGSSIVAEDTGALRLSVVARICEEVAALHASGVDVVVVTSGAIARGIHLLGLDGRPRAVEELQAASAVGPGPALPHLRRVPARARHPVRPGAADVLRHERAHALPERAPHAAQARRVADRPGHQRERHDHDRRDLLRRQRLPRRAGRGAGRRVAAVAADLDPGAVDRRPARRSVGARWSSTVADPAELEALSIGSATSPLGSGGMRSKVAAAEMATAAGIPTVIGSGFEPGLLARAWAGEAVGTRFAPHPVRQPSFKLWLRYAKPSQGVVAIDAGAARALRDGGTSLLPVGIVGVDGVVRGGRRGRRVRRRRRGRQGHLELLRVGAAAGDGDEVRPRCARCCRARPRKRSTGTTSSSSRSASRTRSRRRRGSRPRTPRGRA